MFKNIVDAQGWHAKAVCDIGEVHLASNMALLGMVSMKLGRSLDWDGATERILNDEAANNLKNYLGKITAPDTDKKFADAGVSLQESMKAYMKAGYNPVEAFIALTEKLTAKQDPAQAKKLAAKPLSSLIETKRLMKGGQTAKVLEVMAEEGESFGRMLREPAAREAFSAFMEKRRPDFSAV